MANQALGFGELLAGGVLLTAAITGAQLRDILSGKHSPVSPLASDFPLGPSVDQSAAMVRPSVLGARHGGKISGKGAVNPFPAKQWVPGRTDQGVDFAPKSDHAPILAPMDGTVIKTGAPGWPGGGGVLLKLANGKIMYFYETLTEAVHAGERVAAGQVIAYGHTGGTGVEVGFSDSNGVPLSHANYTEGKVTQWGSRMKAFLSELGVNFP